VKFVAKILLSFLFCGIFFAGSSVAFSATSTTETKIPFKLSIPFPGLEKGIELCKNGVCSGMAQYITTVYQFLVGFTSLLAVLIIIWGGLHWAFGKPDVGRDLIKNAVIGLCLSLGSFVILYTINPQLTFFPGIAIKGFTALQFEVESFMSLEEVERRAGSLGLERITGLNCTGDMEWPGMLTDMTADDVNRILQKTPLNGLGATIVAEAQKNNIDPGIALAMWRHESLYGTAGIGKDTNSPGNMSCGTVNTTGCCYIACGTRVQTKMCTNRCAPCDGSAGEKGRSWQCYNTLGDSIPNWFSYIKKKYADNPKDPSRRKLNGLISVYAPPSENDTAKYIDIVSSALVQWAKPTKKAQLKQALGCTK
jgi:hypothetical protein